MDCLLDSQEQSMIAFVGEATGLEAIRIWSSYARLQDLENIMKSQRDDFLEYIKTAVKHFYTKISIESKIEPKAPQSVRSLRKLSIDAFENMKLMESIHTNLMQTKCLQELTLIGYRMTEKCAEKLNESLVKCKTVKKLRISFCIYK